MKKRILALLLSGLVALCLLPAIALAAPDFGQVYLGMHVIYEGYGSGLPYAHRPYNDTAIYDPDSNTLTLTNYSGDAVGGSDMGADFSLILVGRNTVSGVGGPGIAFSGTDVSISGNGSLICTGISIDGDLSISGSVRVTSTGADSLDDNDFYSGIDVGRGNLSINGNSVVVATAGNQLGGGISRGIYIEDGNMAVSDRASVTARGGRITGGLGNDISAGVEADSILVSGGKLDARGGSSAGGSIGLLCNTEISGGHLVAGGSTRSMSSRPVLSRYIQYSWRTSDSGRFIGFNGNNQTAYAWTSSQVYVEIKPFSEQQSQNADADIPKTGDSAMPWLWASIILAAAIGIAMLGKKHETI